MATPPESGTTPIDSVVSLNGDIPVESIQFALHRILSSKVFSSSPRHRDFLRFTVEETLAGRAVNLKEYVVGVKVFHQEDFSDPRTGPIVRVGASRVRAKLKAYHDSEGKQDPVLIEFPKGSYAPVFRYSRHG